MRVVRALALIAVGALIVIEPDAFLHLLALAVGLYVAYAGVSELLRITIAPATEEQREAERTRGRRVLVASGIAIGGDRHRRRDLHRQRRHGERACACGRDRGLQRGHGALRSPAQRGGVSLGAQRDVGGDQPGLAASASRTRASSISSRTGFAGMLIDAHYGQPTEGGKVKTDLSDLSRGEREMYETRARPARGWTRRCGSATGSSSRSPRARASRLPLSQVLRARRDPDRRRRSASTATSSPSNPNEVLMIVIEDYVDPEDIAKAVEGVGADRLHLRGAAGPAADPPADDRLRRAGADDGREGCRRQGSIPWYH